MTAPPFTWTPDPRTHAQLVAQWRELQKAGSVSKSLEEAEKIREQMEWISAELEARRIHGYKT